MNIDYQRLTKVPCKSGFRLSDLTSNVMGYRGNSVEVERKGRGNIATMNESCTEERKCAITQLKVQSDIRTLG